MHCPKCDAYYTIVTDSREKEKLTVYRRRKCLFCGYRFTTLERRQGYESNKTDNSGS